MSKSTDWLPNSREGQLAMANDWISVCTDRKTGWNIPDAALTELTTLRGTAAAALETAKNETTRTPVATALCKEAFDALSDFMRDFKRRYFLSPPLTAADFVSLGLKPYDTTHTASGKPSSQVMVETYLVGRHELGVKIVYVTGSTADPANKGYRIWYRVAAAGETPPDRPDDLRLSFYTQRKKDLIEFDYGDSGKTAYFAVQVENGGKKGPWGPMISALIP